MGARIARDRKTSHAGNGKTPRTARGERTLRAILNAARDEIGQRGFSDSSIAGITQRAGVALGTFYTYFDSKEALFQALVKDMSGQVRDHVAPVLKEATNCLDGEQKALESFLQFARRHRDVYRIIDEAEFVDPAGFREHYETTASRIVARLKSGRDKGEIRSDFSDQELEYLAWAMMGANVFLGLRYSVWGSADPKRVAEATARMLSSGLQ